jgi:serine-type D-Ala-D-Ala carboxypeptidase/endopeptidase (penicillin-binding protein 4)
VRFRLGLAVAVLVALLAAAGAAYVVSNQPNGRAATRTTPLPPRTSPLLDLGAAATEPAPAVVGAVIRRALARTDLGTSITGTVVDGSTGAQLFARRSQLAVPPASTLKLFTAAAALTVLRPNETLTTGVVRSGGTLYLVGGGDVTLTATPQPGYPPTATLSDLAAQTAAALGDIGPMRVRYDAGSWSGPTLASGWTSSYLTSGNVSRLSALELNEARLTSGSTAPRNSDPAQQTADAFRRALTKSGVDVAGRARPGEAPPSGLGIATVDSPTVAALVQRMLTTSDNDLAEALGRVVAIRLGLPATFTGAASAVREAVGKLGIPTHGVRLYDASGLSRLDRVTSSALVALLRIATHGDARLTPIVAGLPVAGFTGTLAERYEHGRTRSGAGVVRAKTGTLAGVNALAGEVVDADGRLLLFAFVVEHVPDPSVGEAVLDRLAASLAPT